MAFLGVLGGGVKNGQKWSKMTILAKILGQKLWFFGLCTPPFLGREIVEDFARTGQNLGTNDAGRKKGPAICLAPRGKKWSKNDHFLGSRGGGVCTFFFENRHIDFWDS